LLDNFVKGEASSYDGATIASQTQSTVLGHPAERATITSTSATIEITDFQVGSSFYAIEAIGQDQSLIEPDYETLLSSLALLPSGVDGP
jgi:hypothetical protein